MERIDGQWRCLQCGSVVIAPDEAKAHAVFATGSGKPRVRILSAGDDEIHRCSVTDWRATNRYRPTD
jgi:hypothetical protein